MSLKDSLEEVATIESINNAVKSYYDHLKNSSEGYLFLRRDIARPKGFFDFVFNYIFSDRPQEMDAIENILEERKYKPN